jgi:ubiquinone/menaquinone biosynthesis C-methylase UbiE
MPSGRVLSAPAAAPTSGPSATWGFAGADRYTHGHDPSVLRAHSTRTVADSAAYLVPHLRPGLMVLDVGCGPATITADLAALVAPGHVVGLDTVPAVLTEAAHGLDTAAAFAAATAYRLPFADATFDIVHAHQVLQHLSDPVAALREMARVCRPGGLVAARDADYAAMTWYPASTALDGWLDLYHSLAHANGAEPDAGRRLLSWAQAAGLTEVVPSASTWLYATPDRVTWWARTWADRVVHSRFAADAVQRGLASTADLDALAAGWADWASHPDAWFLIVHGEVLSRVGCGCHGRGEPLERGRQPRST